MGDHINKSASDPKQFDIISIGELLIDFVGTDDVPGAEANSYAETYQANPGGAPANVVCTAQKLGLETAFIGAVGQDHFGRLLTHVLENEGVNTDGITAVDDAFTTLAFVSLDEDANRSFSFSRKPGADTCLRLNKVQEDIIQATRVLHFGTLSLTDEPARSSTMRAVEQAKAQGSIVSFDPNVRLDLWSSRDELIRQIEWGIHHCDVLKASEEDLAFYDTRPPEEVVVDLLRGGTIALALLSQGADGSNAYWRTADGQIRTSHAPIGVGIVAVDTTGAGDIFTGSFLSQLLLKLDARAQEEEGQAMIDRLRTWLVDQDDLDDLLLFANQVAGLSTQKFGGITSIPTIEEWTAAYGAVSTC